MKMKKNILAFAVMAGVAAGSAQALVIDNFDDATPQIVSAPNPGDTVSTANAIGGARTISNTKSGPLGVTSAVLGGFFSQSASALTSGTSTITWDANGAGLGGVDLTDGLVGNWFAFDIQSIDQGQIDFILGVRDTNGNSDSYTLSAAAAGRQTVAFSNFAGVDFTQVDLVSLEVQGSAAADLTLDLLQTRGNRPLRPSSVPEPMTALLLGGGLLGFGIRRRRAGR